MTGKAAGSAGVCTTDTCLDSITGSESHSFLPIKTEKNYPHPRKFARASPSFPLLLLFLFPFACRIGNCFEPSKAAISHPPFALFSSSFSSTFSVKVSLPTGPRDTSAKSGSTFAGSECMSRWGVGGSLADAFRFRSFISSVVHLPPRSRSALAGMPRHEYVVETLLYFVMETINAR